MAISLTSFKSQYDNEPKQMDFSDWQHFERFLYVLSQRPLGGKKDAELISPAVYVNDSNAHEYPDAIKEPSKTNPVPYYHRKNRNVTHWAGWAAVDVDDIEIHGDVKDVVDRMCGSYRYVCYSTASSQSDKPKFRIVFQLSRDIEQQQIKHFWFALNTYLDSAGDRQTKDLSRMYYVPATYDSAYNFIFSGGNDPLDVDGLLAQFPYVEKQHSNNFMDRLPEAIQRSVIEHRKAQMDASFHWSGYGDCPFWPRRLADEYRAISQAGWYHKMYQIMVATASRAISKNYPITASQIADLCKEFDRENGNWYENRPLEVEADRALEYAYRNN